jgi:nucleoid DNA-binding protein
MAMLRMVDFYNLVAHEVGGNSTPSSIEKVLKATQRVILKELKLNRQIRLTNFGTLKLIQRGGKDMRIGNFKKGETEIKYVKPKLVLGFNPSSAMEVAINDNDFELLKPAKRGKTASQRKIEHRLRQRKEPPSMDEIISKMANKGR